MLNASAVSLAADALAIWLACFATAQAQGFAAAIAPSRLELRAEPGEILGDTLSITNPSETTANFVFQASDWNLNESGGVQYFEDVLIEGSCQPWVRLERRTISLRPGGQENYRFEVHVPSDAAPGLCRFAIIIEPAKADMPQVNESAISIPVVGRYAVITYVTIGDAAPVIENLGLTRVNNNGQELPAISLRNIGTSHDRIFGQVNAIDAAGTRISMIPSTVPILPGRTEVIPFSPERDATGRNPLSLDNQLQYPVTLNGQIEAGGQSIEIDSVVE